MDKMLSRQVAKAAIEVALSDDRGSEKELAGIFKKKGIYTAAGDYGGEYMTAVARIVERAIVAAKREGVIDGRHAEEGAVAGAAHEAARQIMPKALGLNVGGKIGVARGGDHVAVALYFGIGLVHLDDVAIAVGHRAVAYPGGHLAGNEGPSGSTDSARR